ncbi:MAG: DNA-processing protein DprA [Spirochaetes bacterium]|nr:DNA-processing protein DprA [Spirochaetota bacterium]MBN2771579.1 DNA-processing protein DprA [Spirochaetota bacterium]
MTNSGSYYLLLLSLLSAPVYRETLLRLEYSSAQAIFEDVRPEHRDCVAHIKKIYGADVFKAADKIVNRCAKIGVDIIPMTSSQYPLLLSRITDPPLVLYRQGEFCAKPAIAIVGSRNSNNKSEDVTARLCCGIAGYNHALVSGIARGIDRSVHVAALQYHAPTIAVTACGLDKYYPGENRDLFKKIKETPQCSLISEHPPGIGVMKWTFVRRNRIISGLCKATVVVQAGINSGALITARCAIEQNRDLFVTPCYPYDSSYYGSLNLINQGAIALMSHEQIFSISGDTISNIEESQLSPENKPAERILQSNLNFDTVIGKKNDITADLLLNIDMNKLSRDGKSLAQFICDGVSDCDELVRLTGISSARVSEILLEFELENYIKRTANRIMPLTGK